MKSTSHYTSTRLASLTVVSILFGTSAVANAASITFYTSWDTYRTYSNSDDVDNRVDYLDDTGDTSILKFDPTLGALQSIDVSFSSMSLYSKANANFRDDDWGYSNVSGSQSLSNMGVVIQMPGIYLIREATDRSATCSNTGGLYSGASCYTTLSGVIEELTDYSTTLTSALLLSAYTGTGSRLIEVNQYARMLTDETNGDDGYINSRYGRVDGGGSIQVTYNYAPTPVPVPAAVWLFGSGLLGLIGVARRKRVA